MTWEWDGDNVTVFVQVSEFTTLTIDDVKDMVHEIREKASSMTIQFDLEGVNVMNRTQIQAVVDAIRQVLDYTRDDELLERVEILNAGIMFRLLYPPFSLLFPRLIRDMIIFV